ARRIADAGLVTLVKGGADDGVRPRADARLAGVGLRAGVTVVAGAAVRLGRIGAGAARRIADARLVALVEGCTDDRRSTDAAPSLAGIAQQRGVGVEGGAAVGRGRV